jgi:hypothetical protein
MGSFRPRCGSDNDARTIQVCVRLPESRDYAVAASLRRSEIHKQHLIFGVIYRSAQCLPASHQIGGGELALENGKLKVISKTAHEFEDLS